MHSRRLLLAVVTIALSLAAAAPAFASDVLVSNGSPPGPFSQNKQNEPAVALDAHNPTLVVAGSNDNIDMELCNAGDPTDCPFTFGVGVSGVYFSFDGGNTWTQPTYTGLSARDCTGPDPCNPHFGPIGTLPWYFEKGLISDGDPALTIGPRPDANGHFSWANGSRVYYANLTSGLSGSRTEGTFKGFEALAVSRTDRPHAAAAGNKSAWMRPVIVSKQNASLFSDKEQIWADNAASSPFFGNVYVCNAAFRSQQANGPEPITFTRSTNGGSTWAKQMQLSAATNNHVTGGRQGCTVRTDSHGVVYVFWLGFSNQLGSNVHYMVKSSDGGVTFTRPRIVTTVNAPGARDVVTGDIDIDGNAGARADIAAAPSVDIANGAPTGAGATNLIADTWNDGDRDTSHALVITSTDGGRSWSGKVDATEGSDRAMYSAVALSPNGQDLYLVYDAFLQPFQDTTAAPRMMQGVVRHADISAGTPVGWSTVNRGPAGDARSSSRNGLVGEFLGDYNYAAATNNFGVAVWNDSRNGEDCSAIDTYRQSLIDGNPTAPPAVNAQCLPAFGNSDIFGGHYDDPTP